MRSGLVVKVTAGEDGPERCAQAFSVASVAALSGVRVSLWLTGEASWFALPGRAEQFSLAHSAALSGLLPGMQKGLVNQTVGSRVLLVIPPAEGYPQGNATPKVNAGDTLVMVVDLLYATAGQ